MKPHTCSKATTPQHYYTTTAASSTTVHPYTLEQRQQPSILLTTSMFQFENGNSIYMQYRNGRKVKETLINNRDLHLHQQRVGWTRHAKLVTVRELRSVKVVVWKIEWHQQSIEEQVETLRMELFLRNLQNLR